MELDLSQRILAEQPLRFANSLKNQLAVRGIYEGLQARPELLGQLEAILETIQGRIRELRGPIESGSEAPEQRELPVETPPLLVEPKVAEAPLPEQNGNPHSRKINTIFDIDNGWQTKRARKKRGSFRPQPVRKR